MNHHYNGSVISVIQLIAANKLVHEWAYNECDLEKNTLWNKIMIIEAADSENQAKILLEIVEFLKEPYIEITHENSMIIMERVICSSNLARVFTFEGKNGRNFRKLTLSCVENDMIPLRKKLLNQTEKIFLPLAHWKINNVEEENEMR